jgi:hypothetical protein
VTLDAWTGVSKTSRQLGDLEPFDDPGFELGNDGRERLTPGNADASVPPQLIADEPSGHGGYGSERIVDFIAQLGHDHAANTESSRQCESHLETGAARRYDLDLNDALVSRPFQVARNRRRVETQVAGYGDLATAVEVVTRRDIDQQV